MNKKAQIAARMKLYRLKPEVAVKLEASRLKRYAANPGKQQAERQRAAQKRRTRFAKLMAELKAAPCLDCGNNFPPVAMDFDHAHGKKKFNIALARDKPKHVILKEIEKCDLICACCHRIRTARRGDALLG